jgi:hypothetical protein
MWMLGYLSFFTLLGVTNDVFLIKVTWVKKLFTNVIIYAMFGHNELTQRSTYLPTLNMHPIRS